MPKVSEKYKEAKRQMIVDTAYKICLRKTVGTVTMLDLIRETKLSQGGIYRFYKDLDEILAEVMDKIRRESRKKDKVELVLDELEGHLNTKEELIDGIRRIFAVMGSDMEENLMTIEKIDYEMKVLAMSSPERYAKIMGMTKEAGHKRRIVEMTKKFFFSVTRSDVISFRITEQELWEYIFSTYLGIQSNSIFYQCYNYSEIPPIGPKGMMELLGESIVSFIE